MTQRCSEQLGVGNTADIEPAYSYGEEHCEDDATRRRIFRAAKAAGLLAIASLALKPFSIDSNASQVKTHRVLPVSLKSFSIDGFGWPIKPFNKPHPIRGNFDDPRIHEHFIDAKKTGAKQFHFGVDISALDGTMVYSITSGFVKSLSSGEVSIEYNRKGFEYWHIRPKVHKGEWIRRHQPLGRILPHAGHVHLSQTEDGRWINPRLEDALTPDLADGDPVIGLLASVNTKTGHTYTSIKEGSKKPLVISKGQGIYLDVYERSALRPRGAWEDAILSPQSITWSLVNEKDKIILPPDQVFNSLRFYDEPLTDVYATGTVENMPWHQGTYDYWLTHKLEAKPGRYGVIAKAVAVGGRTTVRDFPIEVRSPKLPAKK